MAVVIVGGGLAGMAVATRLKLIAPSTDVSVINFGGGNTLIAGQRYRMRGTGGATLLETLEGGAGEDYTEGINYFSRQTPLELDFWTSIKPNQHGAKTLTAIDNIKWFGPQLGHAKSQDRRGMVERSKNVLNWFRILADELGVHYIKGQVTALKRDANRIVSADVCIKNGQSVRIKADAFVLAGGNPGGSMFRSTNAAIAFTPQELALTIGVSLVDEGMFLFHPFARRKGPEVGGDFDGCFETDALAGATVRLPNYEGAFTIVDREITDLLDRHEVHDRMKEVTQRLLQNGGGMAEVTLPSGQICYTEIAHHYSHIALQTSDGVSVTGVDNLWAIGDAGGTGYWTGHTPRLPGIALTACFVGAARAAEKIVVLPENELTSCARIEGIAGTAGSPKKSSVTNQLKLINTEGVLQAHFGKNPAASIAQWIGALEPLQTQMNDNMLLRLSLLTARACEKKYGL